LVRFALAAAALVALAYAAVLVGGAVRAHIPVAHHPCPSAGSIVQVDTRAGVLSLCHDGSEESWFRVALGRGGLDKRRELDGRTPLGRYPLGAAIPSADFGLFLPVGYPTKEQLAQGRTGGAIGVHGPHGAFRWLGDATTWRHWTQGCIAVG